VAWIQVARGSVLFNGEALTVGDGVAIDRAETLTLMGTSADAEILLFDMAESADVRG
jgi:redox-sensitive bicupin YhaK (pirin superfamily)